MGNRTHKFEIAINGITWEGYICFTDGKVELCDRSGDLFVKNRRAYDRIVEVFNKIGSASNRLGEVQYFEIRKIEPGNDEGSERHQDERP